MFLLRAVLKILVKNVSPRGPMCFRCMIFNLSGPCKLLFFTLFHSLLDLRSSECDVVYLYVVCCSVNVTVCFVCCVFDSVCVLFVKQFAMWLGVVAILLLNGMDVFSVCGGPLLDRPCMFFQRVCVCCACDPNERLSASSTYVLFVFLYVGSSSHLGV